MELLLDWLKPILYFAIFLTVLLQLLPSDTYKKYVKFFAGLLLVVLVAGPVLDLFGQEGLIEEILRQEIYQEEQRDRIEWNPEALEQSREQVYEDIWDEIEGAKQEDTTEQSLE